jgi:O-antigen/teichoic acid export membrane protein
MYKGLMLHTVARIVFVLVSYLMHFFLGRYMSPSMYGTVGIIITIINFDYLFLNNGVRQAISKTIAENLYNPRDIIHKGLFYQLALIIVIFCINYFGANIIAELLGDPGIAGYIQWAAYIIPFTGIYFLALGIFNGYKLFVVEAILATIYPLLRLLVIPSTMYSEDPVIGTELGFFWAALIICILALFLLFKRRHLYRENASPKIEHNNYLKTVVGYIVLFSISTIIMNADTLILTAFSANKELIGWYTGAVTFGKVPYFLVAAFYLVILPIVTDYYSQGKLEEAKNTIKNLLTILLAVILPIVTIIGASSETLLSAFYSPEYAVAGPALTYLIFGVFFLGLMLVFSMSISATGKKKINFLISIGTLVAFITMCVILTIHFSMTGTALASFIVCLAAMVASAFYVYKLFGNFISKKHLIIIVSNVFLFIGVKLLFSFYPVTNLMLVILIYFLIFMLMFFIMKKLHIISLKQIIFALKKEKAADE